MSGSDGEEGGVGNGKEREHDDEGSSSRERVKTKR